ncbi:hypothetical protein L1281_002043 [Neisseria sp. HSC-16F19]|nr:hypothetical protein [Neisseria sp. HSC-16F19]MCP2041443.1 hypothetical protein [Neisseria sp. HSC-16F19]
MWTVIRTRLVFWLLAVPLALLLGWYPVGCAPQPAAALVPQPTESSREADLREADAAWQAIYGGMSEDELMRAVVFEPLGE